ncbi:MAG: transglycosylase SLT domain-containing protein [Firmicutes bacterium]|nr:transglycosylase SLT domain-containing protein [Bacillota bacterium]
MRRRWIWWLVGGGLVLGGGSVGLLLLLFFVSLTFLAGLTALQLGPGAPAFATALSRPAEWFLAVNGLAVDYGLPNTLVLAVIQQASGGAAYGDRYYCSNGQTAGEWCDAAFPAVYAERGRRGQPAAHTLGVGYGLFGIDSRSGLIPTGQDPHAVAWNLAAGVRDLAANLSGYWKQGLESFHSFTQAPPGWPVSAHYPDRIRSLVQAYSTRPHLGAWALADWSPKTGQFRDPGNRPEWVFAVAVAPSPATFSHAWTPPTTALQCGPVTVQGGKPHQACKTVTVAHDLTGHLLALPDEVVGITANGRRLPFALSTVNPAVPVWRGGTVWGLRVPLTGPDRLTQIVAYWPGWTDTIGWPETSTGAVGQGHAVPLSQAVRQYWAAIVSASCKTGVPADWIVAEMMNESGGNPKSGPDGLAGAYGLMQLEPGTARGLPGWYPGARQNPATNLLLGAELLQENYAATHSWRAASAAYYGGLGSVQGSGVTPGMPWSQAAPRLAWVPDPQAGNTLTMAQYANDIAATAKAVAAYAKAHHLSAACP